MGLLFEPTHERACPLQDRVKIIDTKKQDEAISGRRLCGTHQRRMPMGAPLVEAEQDRSIRVEDLPKVGMGGRCLRPAEQRLVPFEAAGHIAYANNRPRSLHAAPPES